MAINCSSYFLKLLLFKCFSYLVLTRFGINNMSGRDKYLKHCYNTPGRIFPMVHGPRFDDDFHHAVIKKLL